MEKTLQKYFDQIEEQKRHLLKKLGNLPIEEFHAKPPSGKWSVSEIMAHLVTAEKLSVAYMTKKILAINQVSATGLWGDLKLLVFIISQRLPLRYKVPKLVQSNTIAFTDFKELEIEWKKSRETLEKLLNKFSGDQLKKKIYRHPIMGRCNIVHALVFFREHFFHHLPQIERLIMP